MRVLSGFRSASLLGIGLGVSFALFACNTDGEDAGVDTEPSSGEEAPDPETGTQETGTSAGDGDGDTAGDGDGDVGETDNPSGECQLHLADDCSDPMQKCMPYSVNEDRIPDELRCCALSSDPVSLGDRCIIEDYDGSCLDNCPLGTMCVLDSADELEGYCQVFCDAADPDSCPGEDICKPFFEMIEAAATVPLCMSRCDPLLQDCESKGRPGWSCLPEGALSPSFLCMPPNSGTPKLEFEGCVLANDCAVGLACVPSSEVLGCNGLFNCCTRYCDLTEPDVCAMGNACVDLESDVPGLENVGVCADPL